MSHDMLNRAISSKPFFTIITASFNRGDTIQAALETTSSQTYRSFEHIVIDGGSIDTTINLLKQYESLYPLNWTSEPDKGISDALNKGLRRAAGYYIIVLQADDTLINSTILEYVFALVNQSEKDIYSYPVLLDHPSRGLTLRKPIRQKWYNRFKFIFPHQGCFVKRSVFDKIGGFNTSFKIAMDYDFFYRALKHNCSVEFGNFPVALMGGTGIGSVIENLSNRLREEQMVQAINEDNYYWRTAQKFFWRLYLPYKKRLLNWSF
jgi:glycosyltransferase involved in cell wall biosynthesis